VLAFVAAVGGVKFLQIRSAMAQQGSFQPPPETVTTVIAKAEPWEATMNAVGSVVAVNGVTVSADLPGLVDEIAFQSGQKVGKGDVLIRLSTREERAQLASAEAQRELSRVALRRAEDLLPNGVIPQSAHDQAAAEFKQADARVSEIKASIERKTIRAPFSGTLGIRQVNLGQYLTGGAPIVSLQALQPVYVDFSVPQQQIGLLTAEAPVHLKSDASGTAAVGKIAAVDAVIDEATRNARVRAIFDNGDLRLRPGMFVEAQLASGAQSSAITLPASSISYAPFGDSVFIVEDVKGPGGKPYRGVRQQFVKLGGSRGDQVAVLTGVKPGEEIVSSGAFKLRPGAAVQVDNTIRPANSAVSKPVDS
jgi:membrane fusion protein (multidrug efflux system)